MNTRAIGFCFGRRRLRQEDDRGPTDRLTFCEDLGSWLQVYVPAYKRTWEGVTTRDKGFTIGCIRYSAGVEWGGGSLCLHRRYCFCKGVESVGGELAMAIFLLQPLRFEGSLPTHRGAIW